MLKFCRLCGSADIHEYLRTKKNELYIKCNDCLLMQKEELPEADYEESRYHIHQNHRDNIYYHNYIKEIADNFIIPNSDKSTVMLDYGCGQDPYLGDYMKDYVKSVTNYDFFFHPNQPSGRYNLISIIEVIEHLHNPMETLNSVKELLQPGGSICIQTEPYPDSNLKGWGYKEDPTHVIFFNDKVMQFLAKSLNMCSKQISHKRWVLTCK